MPKKKQSYPVEVAYQDYVDCNTIYWTLKRRLETAEKDMYRTYCRWEHEKEKQLFRKFEAVSEELNELKETVHKKCKVDKN